MTSKFLLARTVGNEFLVAVHVDDSRWVDGKPDPEWVHLFRWPAGVEHKVAIEQALADAIGACAARFPDAFPASFVHPIEGVCVQTPIARVEAGRKGGESGTALSDTLTLLEARMDDEQLSVASSQFSVGDSLPLSQLRTDNQQPTTAQEPWQLPGEKDTRPDDGADRTALGFPTKEDAKGAREPPKQPGKKGA